MATDIKVPAEPTTPEQPQGRVAIKSINLKNLLSFGPDGIGPDGAGLELRPLNILIGANGSGKSNLIKAISLLQAAPDDLNKPFLRSNTTVREWLWQEKTLTAWLFAELDVAVHSSDEPKMLHYRILFMEQNGQLNIKEEQLTIAGVPPESVIVRDEERAELTVGEENVPVLWREVDIPGETVLSDVSINNILLEGNNVEITRKILSSIRQYRSGGFGYATPLRQLSRVNDLADRLAENFSNFAATYNKLLADPATKQRILSALQEFYPPAEDVQVRAVFDFLQLGIIEEGRFTAATQLSDGTLRWLALLAVLLHPDPPPLVCIEEPEVGLHPDMIPVLADLLRDASERMQLIITTHSRDLIDEFTDDPESVVVCEKEDGATKLQRLDASRLRVWLEKYSLGQLWSKNHIGGNRY